MSESDAIISELVDDNDLLHMEKIMNKDDQDLRSVFIETGLFECNEKSDGEEDQLMDDDQQPQDDYDVDDLLKDALSN